MDIKKDYSCLERNDIVYHKVIDCDEDYQETLQQYSDDIFRIIKCESKSSVQTVSIEQGKAIVNGKTEIYLTYYNENSELCYADFDRDFSKKISIDNLSDKAFALVVPRDKYTNFRVVNQRRIDVHISISLDTTVFDKHSVPCIKSCENAKLKHYDYDSFDFSTSNYSRIEFDEDFDIPTNSKPINKIISHNSSAILKEYKIIKDKVLIKTDLSICALYTTNDCTCVEKVEHCISLSKIIDISGIDENDIIIPNISVGSLFLKAKNINSDSINCIEAYGEINIYTVFVKKQNKSIIVDGYVPGKQTMCDYSNHYCISDSNFINDTVSDNIKFAFNIDFTEILDLSIHIHNIFLISNKINVKLVAKMLCKTQDGGYSYICCENTFYINCDSFNKHISAICVDSFDYNIESNNTISVRVNLQCNMLLYNESNINVLSNVEITDNEIISPAMTLYFAKKSESLWQIAKQFSSDIDDIMIENDLSSEILDSNKLLIIPAI